MSLSLEIVEVYLSVNVLLAVGTLFAKRWTHDGGRNLALARMGLLACLAAPIAMSFVQPTHNLVLSSAIDFDDARSAPSDALMSSQENIHARRSVAAMQASPFDPWLAVAGLVVLGFAWHLVALMRSTAAVRGVVRRSVVLRRFRRVSVLVSDETLIPLSVRLRRRAYVVLPVSIMGDPQAVAIAVAHECQHHRQGDCVIAYATELLRAACFWNPFVHTWQRILGDLQEFSCDEAVIGRRRFTPHEYGRCLFDVAQAAISPLARSREYACAPGMARQGRGKPQALLLRRIEMLSGYVSAAPRSPFLYLSIAAALITLPFGAALAARGTIAGVQGEELDSSAFDSRIQTIAEGEVRAAMQRLRAKSAAALIMDPSSGRVLAFAEARADKDLESWATRVFAPASTIKPFILAGAIEAGVASETSVYDCRDPFTVAGQTFRNWSGDVGRSVTATETIASSVNVCAIRIAQDMGSDTARAALGRFGLEPDWQSGVSDALQLAHSALGDNEPVTMAQLTKAFSALANRGHIPGDAQPAVSEATAQAITRTLVQAVRRGTGRQAALPHIQTAGKTGTSVIGGESEQSSLAMFGGFAPAEQPEYAAFIIVEDGHNAAGQQISGGSAAAPLFREIIRRSLSLTTNDQ